MKPGELASKQELENRQKAQRRINLYHRVFSTADGKLLLVDLKERSGFGKCVFTRQNKGDHLAYDPLAAALADGARGVVVEIEAILALPITGDGNLKEKPKVLRTKQ